MTLERLLPTALAALVVAGVIVGCGAFTATDPPASADAGGGDGAPSVPRRLAVQLEWPASSGLDPRSLGAFTSFDLELFDGDTSVVKVPVPITDLGKPIDLGERTTGPRVRVTASGVQGNRLVAYGERRDVDVAASATIAVAVRRRLLYFTSSDRDNGQLRVVDMAPTSLAEPATKELSEPLPSLKDPSGLVATSDGKWVVQSGLETTGGTGQLAVLSTSDHARQIAPLDFEPAGVAPIDGGRRILVAPGSGTAFGIFDPTSLSVTKLYASFQGGKVSVGDLAPHRDRKRVAMTAAFDPGTGSRTHHLILFDGTKLETRDLGEEAAGVRWTRDGDGLVVAFRSGDLSVRSADGGSERKRIAKAASDRVVGLVLHPAAPYAYVSCEGRLRIYDLDAGTSPYTSGGDGRGPEFQLTSLARLPYPPYRLLAGQSDPGNNWTQARVVELADGPSAPKKIELQSWNSQDVGSVSSITPLFAEPL